MRKIISLFQRNYDGDHLVRNEVVPGAEWVIAGEGIATRKWDGTCCMIRGEKFFKRYDAKHGKTPPPDFEPAQEPDPITGHQPGWVPVNLNDRWHREALDELREYLHGSWPPDGTYELVGPKVNNNPEGFIRHGLVLHGLFRCEDCPRDFDGIKEYLSKHNIEGIVWHHPDGRMVKIKGKDFGIKRGSNDQR